MVSIITGTLVGLAAGIMAGNGMEVGKNDKGRKVIKKIDWKKGYYETEDGVLAVLFAASAMFGTAMFLEAAGESVKESMLEQEEYYFGMRDELISRAEAVVEEAADNTFDNIKTDYLSIANVARNYTGDLSKVTITNKKGDDLSKFEVYGLAHLSDEDIEHILWNEVEKQKNNMNQVLEHDIRDGDMWDLMIIDEELSILEEELF